MLENIKSIVSGKYRSLIIAIGMFILLDAIILGMNIYISYSISKNAIGVNLGGRLSTMSQRLSKGLYEVRDTSTSAEDSRPALDELRDTYQQFDEAFNAFRLGSTITGSGGIAIKLNPVKSEIGVDALQRIHNIWMPFKNLLSPIVGSPEPSNEDGYQQSLNDAINFAKANNQSLHNFINTLTNELEQIATQKALHLRSVQMVGIIFAVINFMVILVHFISKLRQNDAVIYEARRQNRQILETVNQGLLLIDTKLVIGDEHSENMYDFFGISEIQGLTFDGLLEDMVTESTLNTVMEYIDLLFDPSIKENLVKNLNPLDSVETHTFNNKGRYSTRYLKFSFNRVSEGEHVQHVLITVNDISKIVRLQKDLDEARASDKSQNDLLSSLLHLETDMVNDFIINCRNSVDNINELLRKSSKSEKEHRAKISILIAESHKIKGEASALSIDLLQQQAHKLEDILNELSDQVGLKGNDFMPFTIQLDRMIDLLDSIENIKQNLQQKNTSSSIKSNSNSVAVNSVISNHAVHNLAHSIAVQQSKSVQVLCSGLEDQSVPEPYIGVIRETIIQMVRNAVAHGAETSKDRIVFGKPEYVRVEVCLLASSDGGYELRVSDDGKGIDTNALRQKAIKSGKWSKRSVDSLSDKKLMSLIFVNGFTTATTSDLNSGRGVGMSVVHKHIREQKGSIRISSKPGKYTRFTINFPPVKVAKSKAA